MTNQLNLKIRMMDENDFGFIKNSWLKSYKDQKEMNKLRMNIFKRYHEPIVKDLIENSQTFIAYIEDEPEEILSYASIELKPEFLISHYIYTKRPYRNMGIASWVLQQIFKEKPKDMPIFYTHWNWGAPFLLKHIHMEFNPYLLWKHK